MKEIMRVLLLASFAIPQCASMPYSLRALRRALKDEPAPALVRRQAPPPLISWSRISFHGTVVVNNTLFCNGGDVSWRFPNGTAFGAPNNDTLTVDLSKSWNNGSEIEFGNVPRGDVPVLNLENLWPAPDNASFYSFGGIESVLAANLGITVPARSLAQYTLAGPGGANGSWSSVAVSAGSGFSSITRPAAGLSASGGGKGFVLGGFAPNVARVGYPISGMLTYDMAANQWTNDSATGFSPAGTAILGTMEYLGGYGKEGVLVAFGGQTADMGSVWYDEGANLLGFEDVYVYDIASKTWHHQRATGAQRDSIPAPRDMFCSAIAPSANGNAYEIVVYGGQTSGIIYGNGSPRGQALLDANAALKSTHVLTIPSFTWFRVNDTSAPPHAGHTCEVVGKGGRQMMSVGGVDPSIVNVRMAGNATDAFPNGFGVFDMVDLKWKLGYDANAAAYVQPDVVQQWYTQNHKVDWNDTTLEAIFTRNLSLLPNVTSTPPAPSPSAESSSGSGSAPVGTIVGAVIGGLVGLAALILVAFLLSFLRRQKPPPALLSHRSKRSVPELEDPNSPSDNTANEKLGERVAIRESQKSGTGLGMGRGARKGEWRLHEMPAEREPGEIEGLGRSEMEGSGGATRTVAATSPTSDPTTRASSSPRTAAVSSLTQQTTSSPTLQAVSSPAKTDTVPSPTRMESMVVSPIREEPSERALW